MGDYGDHGGVVRPMNHRYGRGGTSGAANLDAASTSFPETTFGANSGVSPNRSRDVVKPGTGKQRRR